VNTPGQPNAARNPAASVRQRLLNLARETGEDFNMILTRYAAERLLFRLSHSRYRSSFILKGAMLLAAWRTARHRPTRDLDLSGYGTASAEELAAAFREIAELPIESDGLEFDAQGIGVSEIREDQEYHGSRVVVPAKLGSAKIKVQVDVGFGDVVIPNPQELDFPTLLGSPSPRIRAYPAEAVIAEKLQAMISLGIRNSRMKDFYDILVLSRELAFEASSLAASISATFECRRTPLPSPAPGALTAEFGSDPDKAIQWNAFLRRSGLEPPAADFAAVVREISAFLLPVLNSASSRRRPPLTWKPGGPWG
jgi:predicted nucleotidyltransferase component of viral defense system